MMYIRLLSLALFLSVVFAQTGLEGSKWGLVQGEKCETGYELTSNDCRTAAEKMGKKFKALRREHFSKVVAGCYAKEGQSTLYFNGVDPQDNEKLPTGKYSLICEKPAPTTESSEEEKECRGSTFTKCDQCCDILPGKVVKMGMKGHRCNDNFSEVLGKEMDPCTPSRCCETGVERTAWEVEEENDVVNCAGGSVVDSGECCPQTRIYYSPDYMNAYCCPAGTEVTGSFSDPCTAPSTKSLLAVNRALKEALKAALN